MASRSAHALVVLLRYPVGGLVRWLFDTEIEGRSNLPSRGPYIMAPNHLSLIDPPLVTLANRRLVHHLALDELFGRSVIFDKATQWMGTIPMSRTRPPLGALKTALELLEAGQIVGVFPEGARARYLGERPPKNGAAWLSLATGAPIVPVAINGSEGLLSLSEPRLRFPSIRLSILKPIYPDGYVDCPDPLTAMMRDWFRAIDDVIGYWHREEAHS